MEGYLLWAGEMAQMYHWILNYRNVCTFSSSCGLADSSVWPLVTQWRARMLYWPSPMSSSQSHTCSVLHFEKGIFRSLKWWKEKKHVSNDIICQWFPNLVLRALIPCLFSNYLWPTRCWSSGSNVFSESEAVCVYRVFPERASRGPAVALKPPLLKSPISGSWTWTGLPDWLRRILETTDTQY